MLQLEAFLGYLEDLAAKPCVWPRAGYLCQH